MHKLIRFTLVTLIAGLLWQCSTTTEPATEGTESATVSTANVKTEGNQYFSFATGEVSSTADNGYDLEFAVVEITEEVAPNSCQYFAVGQYPVFKTGNGVQLASSAGNDLSGINDIPEDLTFTTDDTTAAPVIGKTWFDRQYNVKPDVFVLKTCQGHFGLLQITKYDFDPSTFHITSVHFKYKYNADGSTDFSGTPIDSFATANAYEQTRYFSLASGDVSFPYGNWEFSLDGSSIWLGPNVQVKRLESTAIESVTSITDEAFMSDDLKHFVSQGWYDTDDTHHVIPKDLIYFAKLSNGKTAAFRIINYYDSQGVSGTFTFEWKYLN